MHMLRSELTAYPMEMSTEVKLSCWGSGKSVEDGSLPEGYRNSSDSTCISLGHY